MNNPLSGTDPTGYIIETPWDIANVVYDLGKIAVGYATGNQAMVAEGTTDLVVDGLSMVAPGVPAGTSKVARVAGEGIEAAVDARKAPAGSAAKMVEGNGAAPGQAVADRGSKQASEIGKQADSDKAARVTENQRQGARRQEETRQELQQQHPDGKVQPEQYLRTEDGKIAKDPVTGKGRRLDNVVIKDGKVVDSVETTSKSASKAQQSQKEERIREAGGNYVRDRDTREIVPMECQTREDRRC